MALIGHIEIASKSTYVTGTFSDFELCIDMSLIPSTQWALIRSDGGNLRIADGSGVEYPAYVESIDTGLETGFIKAKMPTISSSSDTDIRINIYDTLTVSEANGATNGRDNTTNAVVNLPMDDASNPIVDISGSGNDGTLTGSHGGVGIIGSAVDVNGTASQYVNVPHDAGLNPGTGDMTWNIWFASDDTFPSASVLRVLFSKGRYNTAGSHVYVMCRGGALNGIFAQYRTSSSNSTIVPTSDYSGVVGDGNFHMASLICDSGTLKLLLDGDEIGSVSTSLNISPSSSLRIGSWEGGTSWNFDGRLDQYAQWDDAKSNAFMKTMFNNVDQGTNFFTSPVYVPASTPPSTGGSYPQFINV